MKKHRPGCCAGGMRRRAAHWFRKITSWKLASEKYNQFVWIDCDCVFLKTLPEDIVKKLMNNHPVRFHHGRLRSRVGTGIETGLVLWNVKQKGKEVIDNICEKMLDGSFRKQKRWDDAWMLTVVAQEMGLLGSGDLVPNTTAADPIRVAGPLCKYMTHKKGIHWKKYGVNSQRYTNEVSEDMG